jgi:hypothetical protein
MVKEALNVGLNHELRLFHRDDLRYAAQSIVAVKSWAEPIGAASEFWFPDCLKHLT